MSRQRRITIASLALVIAVAGGACGGKADNAQNASSKKKTDAAAAEAAAGADAAAAGTDAAAGADAAAKAPTDGKKSTATGAKSASGSATTTSIDVKKEAEKIGLDISKFEGDWVQGSPKGASADDPRPPGCDFSPGQICRFQVTGNYSLKSQDVAAIEVGAYDDGEKTPSFSTKLPGAKKGSAPWYVREFPYTARDGVKEMSILVRLLGADGKELARGEPTVYPIAKLRGN